MSSQIVNIPRSTIVEAVKAALMVAEADQRSVTLMISCAVADAVGGPQPDTSAQVADQLRRQAYTEVVSGIIADNLILNDRSLPPISPSEVARASLLLAPPDPLGAEKSALVREAESDFVESSMRDVVEQAQEPNDVAYDKWWRHVEAYRSVCDEYGHFDVSSQAHRDEFLRRAFTPEEWLRDSARMVGGLAATLPAVAMSHLDEMLDAMVADEVASGDCDPEEVKVLRALVTAEVQATLPPLMQQVATISQQYMDRRYLELWVVPAM